MEVCKCGHHTGEHAWDGEYTLGCCCCECDSFESQDPKSFRGHTGAYARIEAAFDEIKDQVDAILGAQDDLVKRLDMSEEISRLFVNRLRYYWGEKFDVDGKLSCR
jgi:hypothetical protein